MALLASRDADHPGSSQRSRSGACSQTDSGCSMEDTIDELLALLKQGCKMSGQQPLQQVWSWQITLGTQYCQAVTDASFSGVSKLPQAPGSGPLACVDAACWRCWGDSTTYARLLARQLWCSILTIGRQRCHSGQISRLIR